MFRAIVSFGRIDKPIAVPSGTRLTIDAQGAPVITFTFDELHLSPEAQAQMGEPVVVKPICPGCGVQMGFRIWDSRRVWVCEAPADRECRWSDHAKAKIEVPEQEIQCTHPPK